MDNVVARLYQGDLEIPGRIPYPARRQSCEHGVMAMGGGDCAWRYAGKYSRHLVRSSKDIGRLKASPRLHEIKDLLHGRHKIRAAVLGNHYGAAGISEAS